MKDVVPTSSRPLSLLIIAWIVSHPSMVDSNRWPVPAGTSSRQTPQAPSKLAQLLFSLFNKPRQVNTDRGSGVKLSSKGMGKDSAMPALPRKGFLQHNLAEDLVQVTCELRSVLCDRAEDVRSNLTAQAVDLQSLIRHHFSGKHEGEQGRNGAVMRSQAKSGDFERSAETASGVLVGSRNKLQSPESPNFRKLQDENDACVEAVIALVDSDGWKDVTRKSGITVMKKFIPPPTASKPEAAEARSGNGVEEVVDAEAAAKFACVKASGTLDADSSKIYKLFLSNERVHEYNENCREVRDLERLSHDTKVTWAASPNYGPFKARDFVTIVHYRTLPDGTMVVVNRPVEHDAARRSSRYVRAEILIASNIMRPNPSDPSKTDFISVTHVNPGGIVDSAIGARLTNALCAQAPVKLLTSLERAANTPP